MTNKDALEAFDAQEFVNEFVARNDSEDYPFIGEEYDVNLVKFAFEWLFSSDKFRQALEVNQELVEALKDLICASKSSGYPHEALKRSEQAIAKAEAVGGDNE